MKEMNLVKNWIPWKTVGIAVVFDGDKVCKVFHKNPVKVLEFASTQLTQLTFLGDCMHQLAVKHWKQHIYM